MKHNTLNTFPDRERKMKIFRHFVLLPDPSGNSRGGMEHTKSHRCEQNNFVIYTQ